MRRITYFQKNANLTFKKLSKPVHKSENKNKNSVTKNYIFYIELESDQSVNCDKVSCLKISKSMNSKAKIIK